MHHLKILIIAIILIILIITIIFPTRYLDATVEKQSMSIENNNIIDNVIPVYYFGRENKYEIVFKKVIILKDLKNIPSEKHILLLDIDLVKDLNVMNDSKRFVKKEIEFGTPIILIGKMTIINETLNEVNILHAIPLKIISQNDMEYLENIETIYVILTFPKITTSVQLIPSKIFIRNEVNMNIIRDAYNWIIENNFFLSEKDKTLLKEFTQSGQPYWVQISQLDWSSGNNWCPYGKLNLRTIYYLLMNDYSDQYTWIGLHFRQQSVPGIQSCSSDYKTADMYTWIDADYYDINNFLSDYDPTTTYGATSVGITVGVYGGQGGVGVTATLSWSYIIPDVIIHDQSDYSLELAKWWHDIPEDKWAGENVYQIEPGSVVRIIQGKSTSWLEHYGVKYGHLVDYGYFWMWKFTNELAVEIKLILS